MSVTEAPALPAKVQSGRDFRADIQGLRAVAVGAVVLYHAGVPWLTGGYVGVDVFFVISGFLIGGHLLGELDRTNSVSVMRFYARRIRRLMPASIFVVLVTLLLARIFIPPLGFGDVSKDGIAASLAVSNLWFAVTGTDYLANEAPSVFQHYWSLGLEEQFYFVFPLLVLAAYRILRGNRRGLMGVILSVTAASFVLCVVLTTVNQPVAFFTLPTRAWELGVGVCLAAVVGRLRGLGQTSAAALQWLGLGITLMAIVFFDQFTTFPGAMAAVPVVGAAMYIAGGCGRPAGRPSLIMENVAMQFVGRISYSLYLWHWPLLIVPVMYSDRQLTWLQALGLVLLAIVAAVLTERFVERPFRDARWIGASLGRTYGFGAATVLVAVVACVAASTLPKLSTDTIATEWIAGTLPADVAIPAVVPANLSPSLVSSSSSVPVIYANGCHGDFSATVPRSDCVFGDRDSERSIVLLGDSHAAQWFPALEVVASTHGYRLVTMTKSSCPAAEVTVWSDSLNRRYTECETWRENALTMIGELAPDFVIVSNFQGQKPVGVADADEAFARGVGALLNQLPAESVSVVLGDTPMHDVAPPICLSGHLSSTAECVTSAEHAVAARWSQKVDEWTTKSGGRFVDPLPWLCPGGLCVPIVGNVLVYRDRHHLTTEASNLLAEQLKNALYPIGLAHEQIH
ncbi:acyltransferase family protein [Rhodococcus sp. W8901]|uniref:acyltransferase family protein n=1 Tax=Rhodococcus sp. W8901 TaxID=2742603 RepID=UPI0015819E2C|nr:acyltransferase family protein [Rhodococcus sp. W8901]QKT13221.1 acyltransferase [Rhodococcus sp. W8901]